MTIVRHLLLRHNYRSKISTFSTINQHQKIHYRTISSSFSYTSSIASPTYPSSERWRNIPPANLVHLSIGSVYVYSMWTPAFTTALGVVSPSSLDWTHSQVLPVFSTAAVTLGITTALLGTWVEKSGPRLAGLAGSLSWGTALLTTSAAVHNHSLPLLYLGYGIFGGVGWGLMYLAPVTTCMKWFPDRRGLATGMALSAFGLGAAVAPPLIQVACDFFHVIPEYLGGVGEVAVTTLDDGSLVVGSSDGAEEEARRVVVASATDAQRMGIQEGVYVEGSGRTGAAEALASLGVFYGGVGALASRFMTVPHPEWKPDGYVEDDKTTVSMNVGLPVDAAMGTIQFPLLWLAVFGNAVGGLALLSSSKLMITDIWAGALPSVVTSSFATGYVAALGSANAMGRFGWAFASDTLGRKGTYGLYALGIPVVGGAPFLCHLEDPGLLALGAFYGGSVLAISFYGGIFSVLPAYIADLFGQKHAGAIHGKLLTAWAASAVVGPMGLAYLREESYQSKMKGLLNTIDADKFKETFGVGIENAPKLIEAKTVTISRLMDIAPEGTVDPTPFLYDSTCYIAAGFMGVSALANYMIRPIDVNKVLKQREQGAI